MNKHKQYELVVGLEVHAQLMTVSKLFCGDSTAFGQQPNTLISAISLAHPGTLPVLNMKAVEYAVKLGLALECNIQEHSYFDRKNYFYPDLPKGYQITQQAAPICKNGYLTINAAGTDKKIRLNRIHLEEDAGKSIHDLDPDYSCIDLNRAGVPLVEIVTEPDIRSSEEAYIFLTELRKILRWIEVCDGNMEEGSMRCDANISIRIKGDTAYGTRVEIKNLNSIRNVKRAIDFEFARLTELLEAGSVIRQETRSYDADNNTTFSLRNKEEAEDYRYFPDPDLPSVKLSREYINRISKLLPAMPEELKTRYTNELLLNDYDASNLVSDKETAALFNDIISYTSDYKTAANILLGPVRSYCNEKDISIAEFPVPDEKIALLCDLLQARKVNFNNAVKILHVLITDPVLSPLSVAETSGMLQQSDTNENEKWVDEILNKMPEKVQEYRKGKKALQGLFAGEVKKISKGKADMAIVNKLLSEKLNQ